MGTVVNPDDIIYDPNDPVLDAALRAQAKAKLKREKQKVAPSKNEQKSKAEAQQNANAPLFDTSIIGSGANIPTPAQEKDLGSMKFEPLKPIARVFDKFYLERDLGGIEGQMKLAAEKYAKNPTPVNKGAYEKWKDNYSKTVTAWEQETGRKYTRVDVKPGSVDTATPTPTPSDSATPTSTPTPSINPDGTAGPNATNTADTQAPATTTPTTTSATTGSGYSGYGANGGNAANGNTAAYVNAPTMIQHPGGYATPMGYNFTAGTSELGFGQVTPDQAYNDYLKSLTLGTDQAKAITDRMMKAGLVTSTMNASQMASQYQKVVAWTAQVITSGNSNYDVYKAISDLGSKTGGGSSTTTQRTVTKLSASDAKTVVNNAYQQALGRDATADELATLAIDLNKQAAANPSVSTTTTGGGSSSTNTTTGFNSAQAALDAAKLNPEYEVYQQATTYFDAMQSALRGLSTGAGI